MLTQPNIYENHYFKFKIEFPFDWQIRYKSNPSSQLESKANYQITDDDLPMEDEDYRTLVFASRSIRKDSSAFNSKFSMVIHKHIYEYNLQNELEFKNDIIDVKFGSLHVLNREAQTIEIIENAGSYNSITKIIAWKEIPDLWCSIYIGGDSIENFQASENLLSHLKKVSH